MTNGEVIMKVFPSAKARHNVDAKIVTYTLDGYIGISVGEDWWKAPYEDTDRFEDKEQGIYEKAYKEGYDKGYSDGNFVGANRWIPVSERLPEESLDSVIGWDTYRDRCVFVQYVGGYFHIMGSTESFNIIAWRPLPKPYVTGE